jgi:hypothetical protein
MLTEYLDDLAMYAQGMADGYPEDEPPVIPSPHPDQVGGWVYECAYLHFRNSAKPPREVPPHRLGDYQQRTLNARVTALEDMLTPSLEEQRCFVYAMNLYVDHERHGYPEAGGYNDQPASYLYILDCIRTARDNAEAYERQEEAHKAHLEEIQREEEHAREEQEVVLAPEAGGV